MSFDALPLDRKRIAVIGGGISGLASAYLLSRRYHVTLFEAEPRLGGHARTIIAGKNNDQPVDTGFIVFNYANYPNLTRMFADLDVPVAKSCMSFGATIDNGRVEYGLADFAAITAQKRNALRPSYLRMLRDILHFNARAEAAVSDDVMTIGDLVDRLRLGNWFRNYYLMPICGAIWSTPTDQIGYFPARTLVQFFRNHALLSASGQHQWWTVQGGSAEYVRRLEARLRTVGCDLRLGAQVKGVTRDDRSAQVHVAGAEPESFDEVIFACHSDQALRLITQPTEGEINVLSRLRYQDNRVVLHCDPAQMPRRKSCWSSWVYRGDTRQNRTQIGVTYWMNRLQNIPERDPLFVSLNPSDDIPDHLVYDEKVFRHPVFDAAAFAAQRELGGIQGRNRTWFAGAYTRYGFHEDGFQSAVRIADALSLQPA
ncbi:FAD-dependent oxidoreductase [Defluviimonas sp. WL0002]|uniref:FAD-dependent oxidoreductase n=1 Tax=Albidovulum marisflavi TaxID=2984159 RepID=A0ABT2ZGJ9_9RHOB|nr:FAD-dependent oxidoreductase [Defluviimonas sp. WL0002]MCV2870264.1 FAD-dependent oxidoreductase [Defluviimonas sp. WL0002]